VCNSEKAIINVTVMNNRQPGVRPIIDRQDGQERGSVRYQV
jgi:hypothetical protein